MLIFVFGGCAAKLNTEVSLTDYDNSSSNIVIQYAYFPNSGVLVSEFEKHPSFTLYGDGRLIYSEYLVFPMFSMPGYYGGPVFIYQPSYMLNEVKLSEDEVLGFIEYINDRDFMNLDKLYDNNPSYNGMHSVIMNLKWKKRTVESIGNSAPQELNEIINHLREYYNVKAKPYDSKKMATPKVVAKGSGLVAARIKEIAKEHDVTIVEDKLLARALFKLELNTFIPEELYVAVAKILAYIYKLRGTV